MSLRVYTVTFHDPDDYNNKPELCVRADNGTKAAVKAEGMANGRKEFSGTFVNEVTFELTLDD